jgi:hypothetical protein
VAWFGVKALNQAKKGYGGSFAPRLKETHWLHIRNNPALLCFY